MNNNTNTYKPDYIVPPGWVLEEHLDARGFSQTAFAERCGRSAKLINQIIAGFAPIEPQTALEFERVLGMDASIWLNLETSYRLSLAKEKENIDLENNISWANEFPIREMKKYGLIEKSAKDVALVSELLAFLGMGSKEAWSAENLAFSGKLHFRKQNNKYLPLESLSAWLRMGEIKAYDQECPPYNRQAFVENLTKIRGLTTSSPKDFYPKMLELCNEAGVALAVLPQFSGLAVSGIARWLSPTKPLIALTLRFATNDHFWFSFFHEAAHILLHSKKDVFVDMLKPNVDSEEEIEANAWASNFLIPKTPYSNLIAGGINFLSVKKFARDVNINAGIVVGRLQHDKHISWGQLNSLKTKFILGN